MIVRRSGARGQLVLPDLTVSSNELILCVSRAASPPPTPGTPSKKRVRYADEEHLPLESFKNVTPEEEEPNVKRPKSLLLGAVGDGDDVPLANRFGYRAKVGKAEEAAEKETDEKKEVKGKEKEKEEGSPQDEEEPVGEGQGEGSSVAWVGEDEEDDFERMVSLSPGEFTGSR